jgi:antitoxin component YwqK of YwqJK toxin-antitoxin module
MATEEIHKTAGGRLDGPVSVTNAEGRVIERANFAQGVLEGEFTAWKPDGSMERKANFKNGLLHGEMRDLRDGEQTLNFMEGRLHGEMMSSVNGVPAVRAMCKDGQREGEMLLYEPDGRVSTKANFKKGKLEGELLKFSAGKLSMKALYKDGQLEGETLFYDATGGVTARMLFHAGKMTWLRGLARTARWCGVPPIRTACSAERPPNTSPMAGPGRPLYIRMTFWTGKSAFTRKTAS